jgi:hypothetical protein
MQFKPLLAALFCVSALALTSVAVALAGNDHGRHNGTFRVDLTCPNQTYQQALFHGWTVSVSATMNYVVVTQTDGTVVLHNTQADPGGQPLVTCTYVGPISGITWVNTGFFTPAG